jgi:hypothetical protein
MSLLPFEDNELYQIKRWNSDSTEPTPQTDAECVLVDSLDQANVVTSRQRKSSFHFNFDAKEGEDPFTDRGQLHTPVLDIDIPATLIPSSTPGKNHLYFNCPMSWDQYTKLLDVMAEVGILEPGYVSASKKRGFTAVRLPWIRKPVPLGEDI